MKLLQLQLQRDNPTKQFCGRILDPAVSADTKHEQQGSPAALLFLIGM